MFILLMLVVALAATVVASILLAPKTQPPAPSALGDFTFPTADEGRAVPIIGGTVKISGGDVVWWGDLQVAPIKVKVKSGLFSSTTETTGYRYSIGCQYALCQGPIDAIVGMQSNNKTVPYGASDDGDFFDVEVNSPKLFGGDTSEGGLAGTIMLYKGTKTQGPNAYLSAKQTAAGTAGSLVPYSGVGNGGLSFLAPGPNSIAETITITSLGTVYTADSTKPYYLAAQFSVVGSVSGPIGTAYADYSFGSSKINFTITTGSIPFSPGDRWTVTTLATRVAPSYKGLCYAVLQAFYMGTSNYIKPIDFVVSKFPDPLGMGSSFSNLNGDCNAALFIYLVLTDVDSGLGIPTSRMDDDSFRTAATTLKTEGLGVSLMIDQQATADNLINDVLRHVDGVLYVDPTTNLFTLKLARADYDPSTIPEITVDDVQATPDFSRASWTQTYNQIIVKYLDKTQDFNTRSVQVQDPGNIAITGEVRTQTVEYNSLSNATTAMLVAMRVLRAIAYPLGKLTITINRKGWNWRQGGVFKFTWVPLGISNQVFRIAKISYGEVIDGKITIDAIEDVFGLNLTAFDPPPPSGWVNPTSAPLAPLFQKLEEVPYAFESLGIFVLAMAARADTTSTSFDVYQDVSGSDTLTNTIAAFAPVGLLSGAYPAATPANDSTGFTLQVNGADLNTLIATDAGGLFLGKNLLLIDEEWMSWESFTVNLDGTITISGILRGVFDTVPADHASGAKVWFFSQGSGETQLAAYPADLTVQAKLLPINSSGEYPLSSATYITLTTRSRYARPYPPGNLLFAGQSYGVRFSTTLGDVTFTWRARNRITQTAAGVLTKQDAGDVAAEAGTTYKVAISIGGTYIRTVSAIAVETFTYHAADRVSDGGVGSVTLAFYSNANSLDSYQAQQVTFEMTGFGLDFGRIFGGQQS